MFLSHIMGRGGVGMLIEGWEFNRQKTWKPRSMTAIYDIDKTLNRIIVFNNAGRSPWNRNWLFSSLSLRS